MRQCTTLVIAAAALALAACADEPTPTRPSERAPRGVPDASLTAAAPLVFRQISGGGSHTCGVTTDNVAYCWGWNGAGQLGIGNSTGPEICGEDPGSLVPIACSTRPVRVLGNLTFRQVVAGGAHTCGVTTGNAVYCWGSNLAGQLGIGTKGGPDACIPVENQIPCSTRPVRVTGRLALRGVSAGGNTTCAVTTVNVAYCWGFNRDGSLGVGTYTGPETCSVGGDDFACSTRPVRVVGGHIFRVVRAGTGSSCGVTTGNVAYCWGDNHLGQLGIGTNTGPEQCDFGPCSTRPVRVAGGLALRGLSTASGHSCGVTTSNVAYCWGDNSLGELGIGTSTGPADCGSGYSCSMRPVRVVGGRTFTQVNAGGLHACALTGAGAAYCWGRNDLGQLGIGNSTGPEDCRPNPFDLGPCSTRPVRVVGGLTFRGIQAGGAHTCGLTTSSRAYCWGSNEFGQLGLGTSDQSPHPRPAAVVSP